MADESPPPTGKHLGAVVLGALLGAALGAGSILSSSAASARRVPDLFLAGTLGATFGAVLMVGAVRRRVRQSQERRTTEAFSSTIETRLLTRSSRRDRAAGVFVGLFSSLLLVFATGAVTALIVPTSGSYAFIAFENMCRTWLFMLFAPVGVAVIVEVFRWLRQRLPHFAQGYQRGSLIIGLFLWALFVPELLKYLFGE